MKFSTFFTFAMIAIALTLISLWMAQQSYSWLPVQAAIESKLIDNLFAFLVFLGTWVFLGLGGAILYFVAIGTVSRFDTSDGPPIEGNVTLEIVWTVIPIILVIIIASYSYWTYQQMSIRGPMDLVHLHMPMGTEPAYAASTPEGNPTETIEVNAKQWAWTFRYPNANVTSAVLHVPLNQRIHLAMRTEDVIHGFYVPAFRLKQDIIPNKTIEFEFTPIRAGEYRLNDSQFSGTYFAIMQTQVVVEPLEQYRAWLAEAATHPPIPADNQPFSEYTKRSKKGFRSGWKTVPPGPPPLVNQA